MAKFEVVEQTSKASLYKGMINDIPSYLVTIGCGKKIPNTDDINFRRDKLGHLIVKGSWWTYQMRDGVNAEEVKAGAYNLYHKHC